MSTLTNDAHDVFHLRIEIKPICRRALPIATSVDQNDAVVVGQLLLLTEGLFGRIESPVNEDNRLTPPNLTDVQISFHRPAFVCDL
jgi:hypothetical protein